MKRIFSAILILGLVVAIGCSSALSDGDQTADNDHSFLIISSQIIDVIGDDVAPEEKTYLVLKYEVANLQAQDDAKRQWTDQISLEIKGDVYSPISLGQMANQLWETALSAGETKSGYIAYIVPDDKPNFKLLFTFPVSENEVTYDLSAVDKRISVNVDYVLERLDQIESTKGIPVIGGLLNSFTSSPVQYLGVILVPEAEIDGLLEQTKGLEETDKEKVIEDYLLAQGLCRLE